MIMRSPQPCLHSHSGHAWTLITLAIVSSSCMTGTWGFLTPEVIEMMSTSGRPPLQPYVQGAVSAQCEAVLAELLITETSSQLLQVLDAIGKPQAGLLSGNLAWLGHFDECMDVPDFNYCMSFVKLNLPSNQTNLPVSASTLLWGLCVPEVCSNSDILNALADFLEMVEAPFNITAVNASSVLCAQDPPAPYDTGFIVTMFLLGAIGCLMLLGAFLDSTLRSIQYDSSPQQLHINRPATVSEEYPYQRVHPSRGGMERTPVEDSQREGHEQDAEQVPTACMRNWHQFVLCFAVNRNLAKLLRAKSGEGAIDCLNGIRVISMTWVILGHVFSFGSGTGLVSNPLYGYGFISQFGFQAVVNAFPSVDSFFFLSGLLVAYMSLGRMAKTGGSLPWFWFYFHRYWRLTPALGMTMLISLYIKGHLGTGPIWQEQVSDLYCQKYWWTNLLYINNFIKDAGGCIGWVWYLANDMQFYIISPLLLVMLAQIPIAGLVTMLAMCFVSSLTSGLLVAKYGFSAALMDATNSHPDPNHSFFAEIYIKPYCRITPYLVGMAMGYFLHVYKNRSFKLHPLLVLVGWLSASFIGMAVIYGLYWNYHGHPLTVEGSAAYMALSRFAWAISLSWLVFACHFGYGGWINDFLSWELWIPLSRLTYSAYLLHPIIITTYYFNMATNYYYSLYILSFEAVAIVTLAYCAAIVMAVSIEFPLGNMEKMFMSSTTKKSQ